jgi:hypothetical protein
MFSISHYDYVSLSIRGPAFFGAGLCKRFRISHDYYASPSVRGPAFFHDVENLVKVFVAIARRIHNTFFPKLWMFTIILLHRPICVLNCFNVLNLT